MSPKPRSFHSLVSGVYLQKQVNWITLSNIGWLNSSSRNRQGSPFTHPLNCLYLIQATTYIAATAIAETTGIADKTLLTTQFYFLLAESPLQRTKNRRF